MEENGFKEYLRKLDDTPLLTKQQEMTLLDEIAIHQDSIFKNAIKFEYFRHKLASFLIKVKEKDLVGVSRTLTPESKKTEVRKVARKVKKLLKLCSEDNITDLEVAECLTLILEVKLAGNVVDRLNTFIKKDYLASKENKAKLERHKFFFEEHDEVELKAFLAKIHSKKDRKYGLLMASKFGLPYSSLVNKAYDTLEILKAIENMTYEFEEIRQTFKVVNLSEFKMQKAKNALIKGNLRLVVSRAKKFTHRGLEFEDLVQEGNLGLMKAINKHDSSRGTKISTYATWWIDQGIRRAISNKSKTVRIPTHVEFQQSILKGLTSKLKHSLGREPTHEEVLNLAKEEGRKNLKKSDLETIDAAATHQVSMDDINGAGMSLADSIATVEEENPFNITAHNILQEKVRQIIGTLSPRTQKIIRLRFGIGNAYGESTLREIGEEIGISKMGVKLVQNSTFNKLKKNKEIKLMKKELDDK